VLTWPAQHQNASWPLAGAELSGQRGQQSVHKHDALVFSEALAPFDGIADDGNMSSCRASKWDTRSRSVKKEPRNQHTLYTTKPGQCESSVLTRGSAHVYKAVDADRDLEGYFGPQAGQECTGGVE
jgi:hypothetical protein